MIKLTDIRKSYAGRVVLDIDSLEIPRGARCALMGHNGSGKTTLLRVLAGVLAPDSGETALGEECTASRQTGYMPQHPYAYGFSVLRNVTIALHGDREAYSAAKAALESVDMLHLCDARGNKLSGGEAQRMALARIIARRRGLLLLDEPTSGTDISGTGLVEAALLRYWKDCGCTLIFSTHSSAQAARLADMVLVLDHGEIIEAGAAKQVLNAPKSEKAKQFLCGIENSAGIFDGY